MYMYIVVLSLTNIKSNQYCILETKKYGDRNRVLTKLIATLPGGGFSTLDPDVFQSFFFQIGPDYPYLLHCNICFVWFLLMYLLSMPFNEQISRRVLLLRCLAWPEHRQFWGATAEWRSTLTRFPWDSERIHWAKISKKRAIQDSHNVCLKAIRKITPWCTTVWPSGEESLKQATSNWLLNKLLKPTFIWRKKYFFLEF